MCIRDRARCQPTRAHEAYLLLCRWREEFLNEFILGKVRFNAVLFSQGLKFLIFERSQRLQRLFGVVFMCHSCTCRACFRPRTRSKQAPRHHSHGLKGIENLNGKGFDNLRYPFGERGRLRMHAVRGEGWNSSPCLCHVRSIAAIAAAIPHVGGRVKCRLENA